MTDPRNATIHRLADEAVYSLNQKLELYRRLRGCNTVAVLKAPPTPRGDAFRIDADVTELAERGAFLDIFRPGQPQPVARQVEILDVHIPYVAFKYPPNYQSGLVVKFNGDQSGADIMPGDIAITAGQTPCENVFAEARRFTGRADDGDTTVIVSISVRKEIPT